MKSNSIKSYQFVVVYPTSLAEDSQKKDLKTLIDFVKSKGSELSFADGGEKNLAYEIAGTKTARFWIGNIKVKDDVAMAWSELKTILTRNKLIIRYLILKN